MRRLASDKQSADFLKAEGTCCIENCPTSFGVFVLPVEQEYWTPFLLRGEEAMEAHIPFSCDAVRRAWSPKFASPLRATLLANIGSQNLKANARSY